VFVGFFECSVQSTLSLHADLTFMDNPRTAVAILKSLFRSAASSRAASDSGVPGSKKWSGQQSKENNVKTSRIQQIIQSTLAATVIGFNIFICMPAKAGPAIAPDHIYAVDQNDNLFDFYSDAPGTILNQHAIFGIQSAEEIRGIDYWNGQIYGLGSFSHLYTIDPNTGQATMVGGAFSPLLNGATFGVDNDPSGFRVVSGLDQNLLVDRSTGAATLEPALHYVVGDPFFGMSPNVDELAYDNGSGTMFAADTLQNTLASVDLNTGSLTTIGPMGIDASRFNGLDISPVTGIMYMGTPAASSDPQANLYTVNKATGAVTLVGLIGAPLDDILVRGLTVVVPEPSSVALLVFGALGLLIAHRHQR
jgi:Domain of unknown function (DUF4394)